MASERAFDWDDDNRRHLKRHKVSPEEFEQAMLNGPVEIEYQQDNGEGRYKSLGASSRGRILIAIWTVRGDRIRAVTAYTAPAHLKRLWAELLERDK